jgi:MFS family permease
VTVEGRDKFGRIATAGVFFQGGAAAVDTGTIVASLVNVLTGSAVAVGAAAAIARYGWLFPQLFVAYAAQRACRRMPFYQIGAFGRVLCLAAVAALLLAGAALPAAAVAVGFFALWTLYAFVSGVVAVPYNDIVARAIAATHRSRLLALRFFGGGVLALLVAALAHRFLDAWPFPDGYAFVLLVGVGLLLASATAFVSAGEPEAPAPAHVARSLREFLRDGIGVVQDDRRFRLFLYAQWLDGAAAMASPFYVVLAMGIGIAPAEVALLLAAQTAGALLSNPLWGWWGDRVGKRSLLEGVAGLGIGAPALALAWPFVGSVTADLALAWFAAIFFVLGAVGNGGVIAQLGYLMEISPDDQRPAYSGYFNALVAPAALSPLFGAALVELASLNVVFAASVAAAALEFAAVRRLRRMPEGGRT